MKISVCFFLIFFASEFPINTLLNEQVWKIYCKEDIEEIRYTSDMTLDQKANYLFLLEKCINTRDIIYTIGAESTMKQRYHTLQKVADQIAALTENLPGVQIYVNKAMHSNNIKNSKKFLESILLRISKLYRVTVKENKCYITEVPLRRNELMANDSFVLQEKSQVTVWHSKYANSLEKKLAITLATRIIKIDERSNDDNILILDEQNRNEEGYKSKKDMFLEKIPVTQLLGATLAYETLSTYPNKHVKLIQYHQHEPFYKVITKRPLCFNKLIQNNIHTLIDDYNKNIFIILGKNAPPEVIYRALNHLELHYQQGKITIINGCNPVPTNFLIYFINKSKSLNKNVTFLENN